MSHIRDPVRLMDRALLWLHEQEVIRLNKGLAVFPAGHDHQVEARAARVHPDRL